MKRLFTAILSLFLIFTTTGCSAAWDKLDGTYSVNLGIVFIGADNSKADSRFNSWKLKIHGENVVLHNGETGEDSSGTLSECEYSDENTYKCKVEFETQPEIFSGTLAANYTFTAAKEKNGGSYVFNALMVGNYGSAHAAALLLELKR